MSEVSQRVKDLAKSLKGEMTLKDGGAFVFKDEKTAYENTLPEHLNMKTVDEVYKHNEDVTAALTLATGELGADALKKNKKLDGVTSELKIGKHADISVGYLRSQEQRIPNFQDKSKPPEKVTRYGVTTTRIRTFAQKNKGELKKVRTQLSEQAEKLFS